MVEAVATADCTDLEIAGLDGDTDGRYYMEGVIHVPASTAVYYTVRPNGVITNLGGVAWGDAGGSLIAGYWILCDSIDQAGPVCLSFQAWINAQASVGGVARQRHFVARTLVTHANAGLAYQSGYECTGSWRETSTNITSLNIVSSVASKILQGSAVQVYRCGASLP